MRLCGCNRSSDCVAVATPAQAKGGGAQRALPGGGGLGDEGSGGGPQGDAQLADGTGTGTLERACVVGGRASVESHGEQMRNGGLIGGRRDAKAKNFHPNTFERRRSQLQVGGARPEGVAPAAAGTGANRRGAQGTAHGGGAAARPCRGLHGGTWSWAFWRLQAGLHRRVES
jgi:hypothetical protein